MVPHPNGLCRPLRVAVAVDESCARGRLRAALSARDDVVLVAEPRDGQGALCAIEAARRAGNPIDLLLLDVEMPGLTGIDVVGALPDGAACPAVVFVAADDRYAARAFDLNALDYLVKPIDDGRLALAVERARARLETRRLAHLGRQMADLVHAPPGDVPGPTAPDDLAPGNGHADRLAVRTGGRVDLVRVDDVDWVEGAGVYARLHVGDKTHLVRDTLARLEARLPPRRFVRVHRSTIVNVDRVRSLEHLARGEYAVHLEGGGRLKLSRSYRDRLRDLLGPDAA